MWGKKFGGGKYSPLKGQTSGVVCWKRATVTDLPEAVEWSYASGSIPHPLSSRLGRQPLILQPSQYNCKGFTRPRVIYLLPTNTNPLLP